MIDEEKLDILQTQGWAKGFREDCDFNDLIKLARMGLRYKELKGAEELYEDTKVAKWGRDVAKPALDAIENADNPHAGFEYSKAYDALASFPGEK